MLYLLHGGLGSYVDWTESSDVERLTRSTDVLVVMPDAGRLGFYTDWWNHGAGNWETILLLTRQSPRRAHRSLAASVGTG